MALPNPSLIFLRSFSLTAPAYGGVKATQRVANQFGKLPPYPYPPRLWYKKSNFGLFGTARVQFGNNVSERTETKTRRRWYPNVHRKRLWSMGLGRWVRVKVLARVLRTIDKVGGLDEYLLGDKAQRIKELGPGGWAIRWRLMRTPAVQERYRLEREALGLLEPSVSAANMVQQRTSASAGDAAARSRVQEMAHVQEEDLGRSEEELKKRETAIDRALDEDAEREAKGIDGGVELESLDEMGESAGSKPKRRW